MSVERRRRIDFFVSYAGADEGWAEWIAWQLKTAGFQVRIQKWHFEAGSDFMAEMDDAVRKAQRTIAVLSPAYLRSTYCGTEWRNIFTTDMDGRDRRLVPVCIEKCSEKELGLLKTRVYIDLTKCPDGESASQTLLDGLRRGEPETEPAFPGGPPSEGSDADESRETTQLRRPKRYPGTLPAVWTVAHRRNRDFTGREEILESLRSELSSGTPAAVTQAIAGLGGVGKTQLAIEYAYRHAAGGAGPDAAGHRHRRKSVRAGPSHPRGQLLEPRADREGSGVSARAARPGTSDDAEMRHLAVEPRRSVVSVDRRRRIDFFVSYTGADEGWAEWIAWQLKEAGSQVRLQKWHFDAGADFMAEI